MRLSEVHGRVASMEDLLQIVGAMRALASMRVQQAVRTLASVRQYGAAIADAILEALPLGTDPHSRGFIQPPRSAKRAVVLCTSEHGFVGAFNEHLVDAMVKEFRLSDPLLVVGSRGTAWAEERGYRVSWTHPMATRLASVPEIVQKIESELFRLITRGEIARAEVIFARYRRHGPPSVERHQLFPLEMSIPADGATARLPPLHNLSPRVLLEKLTTEHIFAQLSEALMESLASENAARFAAMESAHDNVARKLDQLRQQASLARQEEVTTELLDLVTGAEAMVRESPQP